MNLLKAVGKTFSLPVLYLEIVERPGKEKLFWYKFQCVTNFGDEEFVFEQNTWTYDQDNEPFIYTSKMVEFGPDIWEVEIICEKQDIVPKSIRQKMGIDFLDQCKPDKIITGRQLILDPDF